MKFYSSSVAAIAILLLIITGLLYMYSSDKKQPNQKNANDNEPKTVEFRDFSCPGMSGFTFKYPVFEGWSMHIEKLSDPVSPGGGGAKQTCAIVISHPNLDTKVRMEIYISQETGIKAKFARDTKNTHGVYYLVLKDKTIVDFIGNDVITKITNRHNWPELGFSRDIFLQTVIDSFRLIPDTPPDKSASYGEKVTYEKGKPIAFSDFNLTFTGTMNSPSEIAGDGITLHYFDIDTDKEHKTMYWLDDKPIPEPAAFEVANKKFYLEKKRSRYLGRNMLLIADVGAPLLDNELVIYEESR